MNETTRRTPQPVKKLILVITCLAAFVVFTSLIHTAASNSILGADFYTFWMAGKAAFQEHANPYSAAVTEQIQFGKLGRLANPGEDQMAFAYPPYSLLLILPTVFLSFDWASAAWLALNVTVLTVLIFFLPARTRSFLLSTFLFFPVFLNLVLGQFDIIATSGVVLFFWLDGWSRENRNSRPGVYRDPPRLGNNETSVYLAASRIYLALCDPRKILGVNKILSGFHGIISSFFFSPRPNLDHRLAAPGTGIYTVCSGPPYHYRVSFAGFSATTRILHLGGCVSPFSRHRPDLAGALVEKRTPLVESHRLARNDDLSFSPAWNFL
ncbi:MAG: DUF2029 domain-containing protein [Anaerolineaceae bacterium]|nr:DUF2029 domain-containing protein [Anaerolineaceae bacterium]